MSKSGSATLPKAHAPVQERKPLAPLPPQQRNGNLCGYTNEDFSDTASGDSSLEGNLDLKVTLPDGRNVLISVERRMPMMDLLIQIATAHKLSPGNHQINVLNAQDNVMNYKASTPIGTLNTSCIHLVPKKNDVPSKKLPKQIQPFEPTFRLQVHLPRQQLFVIRVSAQTHLRDIFNMVCQQKELDPNRYSLQHPSTPELQLDLNRTLADYNLTEINVISKRGSIVIPTRPITEYNRLDSEERKSKQLFGLFRRNKSSVGDSSGDEYNNNGRGPSPARIEPPVPVTKKTTKKRAPPPPPALKPKQTERPPPPPPLHPKTTSKPQQINEQHPQQSHSRHSSDSSGYHESSVMGDECPESEITRSVSNLTSTASTSTTSIVSGIKKRRAPPPPTVPKVEEKKVEVAPPQLRLEMTEEEKTEEQAEQRSQIPDSSPLCATSPPPTPPPVASAHNSHYTEIEYGAELSPIEESERSESVSDEPQPIPEPIPVTEATSPCECHDPSLLTTTSGTTTSHEYHQTLPYDGIDQHLTSNFSFEIPENVDKYREETSGSCSRSDTHTTTDSAVADLDLDASGSSSWSPIPEVRPHGKEISVTAVVHCEDVEEIRREHVADETLVADFVDTGINVDVIEDRDEKVDDKERPNEFSGKLEELRDDYQSRFQAFMEQGKYNWNQTTPREVDVSNQDEWIKSSSDDEHETLEAPSSPSSYYSMEDVQASFEQVIAEAESAIKQEETEEELAQKNDKVEIDSISSDDKTIVASEDSSEEPPIVKEAPEERKQEYPKFYRQQHRPLVNFVIESYKSRIDEDETLKLLTYPDPVTEPVKKQRPVVIEHEPVVEKIQPIEDKTISRSSSMHENQSILFRLTPYKKPAKTTHWSEEFKTDQVDSPATPLQKKSQSMMNLLDDDTSALKRTQSEQKINTINDDLKVPTDSEEYQTLQEQYTKLQKQFITWQKQLLNNQALLQQQHIVPQNMLNLPDLDLIESNIDTQNSKEETPTTKTQNGIAIRQTESSSNDQQRAKTELNPVRPFPVVKSKPIKNEIPLRHQTLPVVRVESMKEEKNVKIEEKSDKSTPGLTSVRDRISLFLGKNNADNAQVKKPSEDVMGFVRSEKIDKSFERGNLARKPVKLSNLAGSKSIEIDKVSGHAKFRRQRIMPSYLADGETNGESSEVKKEPPICNGHVVMEAENGAHFKKPRQNRPLVFTYFGESVDNEVEKKVEESKSAVSKVARSEVLSQPSLPLHAMNSGGQKNVEKVVGSEKKVSDRSRDENTPPVAKKSAKPRPVSCGNKFATVPDSRDTLLNSIREFGGRSNLRKVPKSETQWHTWHGEIA